MTQLDGKFVLISGSASRDCPNDRLETAIRFVTNFTEEVLRRGGGVVVLAGEEESAKNERGTPLIFDWAALRSVERFAQSTTAKPRPYARVVMSDQAPASKTDDANLKLLANLEQRNVVERTYIPREVYTGGEYRAKMTKLADAMVAVGGGRQERTGNPSDLRRQGHLLRRHGDDRTAQTRPASGPRRWGNHR